MRYPPRLYLSPSGNEARKAGILMCALLLLVAGAGFLSSSHPARAAEPTPAPTPEQDGGMELPSDRLAPPVMPENPTQADEGAMVFYYVCMACHGDQGQGLTPEWIEEWGLEKNTCWESKCHASNHPPEGFVLPKTIPGVVGERVMMRFGTAQELHDYISTQMPWHAPGTLQSDEYWQLTAFVLRLNGIDIGDQVLGEQNAAAFSWRATPTPEPEKIPLLDLPTGIWVVGAAALVTLGFLAGALALRKGR